MRFIALIGLFFLFSCKKNESKVKEEITLQVVVKDYRPTTNGNFYWGIDLTFNPSVTLKGTVFVEYDIFSQGVFYKHYSYPIPITLTNESTYTYNTYVSAQIPSAEIKNIKASGLSHDEVYSITIMEPKGLVNGTGSSSGSGSGSGGGTGSGSGSSGGCGTHNGRQLYKGPDGGCYYINSSGNKTYVDRSECHC